MTLPTARSRVVCRFEVAGALVVVAGSAGPPAASGTPVRCGPGTASRTPSATGAAQPPSMLSAMPGFAIAVLPVQSAAASTIRARTARKLGAQSGATGMWRSKPRFAAPAARRPQAAVGGRPDG